MLSGLGLAALAQTNAPTRSLSLQDCIAEALQHNFDVRIERFAPVESQLSLEAAYAGYDPTLTLSGQHAHSDLPAGTNAASMTDNNSFSTGVGGLLPSGATYNLFGNVDSAYVPSPEYSSGQVGVSATQPLLKNLWIDQTRLNVIAAKSQIKQSIQGLRLQLITTVTAVESAFFELIYARENLKVQQQALALAQTQLDQDKQRVEVGSLAPLDVQQDEAQVAQSRASLISAQFMLLSDQNALKTLITDNYPAWHDVELEPAGTLAAVRQFMDVQDSWSKGMVCRPELLQAKLTLEQDGIQLKYDRNQLFPEIDLTGSYGYNGGGVGYSDTFGQYETANRPFYAYGMKVSYPLSNQGARSAYRSQKAVETQDLLKVKELEQNIMVAIDNAVKQAESDWESVGATKEARVYAEAALDAEEKKYAVGKSTTFTVLQLQNTLTADRGAEIRALANYDKDLATLAQAEGTTLERHKVEVTWQ